MSGLDTLMREGLDVTVVEGWQPVDAGRAVTAEVLEWHATGGGNMPDADMTVLMWVEEPDGATDWHAGWWDGEDWHDAASGGVVAGEVTHWAAPEGPL